MARMAPSERDQPGSNESTAHRRNQSRLGIGGLIFFGTILRADAQVASDAVIRSRNYFFSSDSTKLVFFLRNWSGVQL